MTHDGFTWRDGERTVVFGRGAIARAEDHLGRDYVLLTTPRAEASAPAVVAAAADVVHVGAGNVYDLAGDLLASLPQDGASVALVALGGGRVIDTAKALGAATGRPVAAIPTTLSAAEMTWVHQPARGAEDAGHARPSLVLNDPELSASQPPEELAASAANALAHAVEAPLTTGASPVPTLAAHEAARLIGASGAEGEDADRDALALAALLSGYAIDGAWYGLSHVCSQTLRAVGGTGHGQANAVVLPHTSAALRRRFPDGLAALDDACGRPVEELASALAARAGASRIRDLGVDEAALERCAEAAASRDELDHTPPRADQDEILGIYRAAW
jgi:alcohol dehydrogenase